MHGKVSIPTVGVVLGLLAMIAVAAVSIASLRRYGQVPEQQTRRLAVSTFCGATLAVLLVSLALWRGRRSRHELARQSDERIRAEERLQQSQRFMQRVLETTPNLVYVYDQIEQRAVYINRQVSAILGYTPEQIQAMGPDLFKNILTEDDQRRVQQAIAEYGSVKDGQVVEWDAPFRRANGEWRWMRGKEMVFTRTPEGKPKQTLGTAEDITERKQAEEALRQSEEQYRTLFELSPDGVALVDSNGAIAAFNEHLHQRLGYTPEEFARLNVADVEANESPQDIRARLDRMLRLGEDRFETKHRTKRGQLRDVAISTRRVDFGGKPYFLAVWRDITEEKQMREQLQQSKQTAETANQAKDQFLAVLSHELRTPLTPVLAMVSLLERDPRVDDMVKEDLDVIRRNVELEARLIDDLLDLTRIVRGKLELRREATDVHVLLERAMSICCEADAVGKQLRVLRSWKAARRETWGDPVRLEQIFWNLLNNAVKFTASPGLIEIRTSNPDLDHIRVEVRDTGVGIEPHAIGRIFDAFEQGHRSVTRQFGGLGLGLAITRRLVELHGGTIAAHSEGRSKGATFTVELPLRTAAPSPPPSPTHETPPKQAEPSHRLRILLVEDHADTARIMRQLLEMDGHEVQTAADVASALEAAGRESFDLLISDLGLPDGSGLELMQRLHSTHPELRGIALSGYGRQEDIDGSRESGFAEHLTKPVDMNHLSAAIMRVTEPHGSLETH